MRERTEWTRTKTEKRKKYEKKEREEENTTKSCRLRKKPQLSASRLYV
jgi:hypothetical protein